MARWEEKRDQSFLSASTVEDGIPLPAIAKEFTDAERQKFLESAFFTIRAYFDRALAKLYMSYAEIETSLQQDTEKREFKCSASIGGQILYRCKIKVAPGKSDSLQISYCSFHSNGVEWISDYLSATPKDWNLMLRASFIYMGGAWGLLTPEQGAARFWDQFAHMLASTSKERNITNNKESRTNGCT